MSQKLPHWGGVRLTQKPGFFPGPHQTRFLRKLLFRDLQGECLNCIWDAVRSPPICGHCYSKRPPAPHVPCRYRRRGPRRQLLKGSVWIGRRVLIHLLIAGSSADIGCILALDGIIFKIPCPQPPEVPNPRAYYCRKGYFGINAQLACGPDLRFRWADVRCTGGTHDQLAYTVSGLDDILKGWPPKYYGVGDNDYLPHEYLLVPYKGRSLRTTAPYKDSFNFHLSQLRIHVERAFGMLTARWGILWKPVSASLAGTLSILKSCFRLHNFCIDSSGSLSSAETISQLGLPRVADEYGRLINDFEVEDMLTINPATSSRNPLCFRREAIVQALHAREILRPHTASEKRQSKRRRLDFDVE
eukprot:g1509.t1